MFKRELVLGVSVFMLAIQPGAQTCQPLEKPVVGFCINLQYSPLVMYKRYQPLMDYLSQQTPYHFELMISRSNHDTVQLLRKGTAQVALLDEIAFIEARDKIRTVPVLKPLNPRGQPVSRSVIIVSAKSNIYLIRDLHGKRMSFGPHHSQVGSLFPFQLLARNGIDLSSFSSYKHLKSQEEVVKSVLWGQSDAGAVADTVAERYLHAGLRIVGYSEAYPTPPLMVREDAPTALVQAITSALLALDRNDPAHEEQMKQWDGSIKYGFSRAKDREYQPVLRMFKSASSGCGKACHSRMRS